MSPLSLCTSLVYTAPTRQGMKGGSDGPTLKFSKPLPFAWEASWGRVLTLDQLKRRGRALANRCFLCGEGEESVDHLLIHFSKARIMWELLLAIFWGQLGVPSMVRKLGRVRYDSADSSPPRASPRRFGYQIPYPLVNRQKSDESAEFPS